MSQIEVKNLGKAYKKYNSRWGRLIEWVSPFKKHQLHWVLNDINFSVNSGEAVAIVGMNGAGKSTLLKMLTGTTKPTKGSIIINGKVAALLELGMGFHPDFTGRQNVYMAGQLLGYTANEITELMPEIESFAEIGSYIDQPVRMYSSGMQMRLAFSIATAKIPEVLIVDEALSVGDAYFQHKSFSRIREYREKGTTLLIVSHDKGTVQSICTRAMLLSNGRIIKEDTPEVVMDYYNALLADREGKTTKELKSSSGAVQISSGDRKVIVESAYFADQNGMEKECFCTGEEAKIIINIECKESVDSLVIGYLLKDKYGQEIFGTNSHHHNLVVNHLHKSQKIILEVSFAMNIGEGTYSLAVALHGKETHLDSNYEWKERAAVVEVINTSKEKFIGVAWLPPVLKLIT